MNQFEKIASDVMYAITLALRRSGRVIVTEDQDGLVTVDGNKRVENFRWVDFVKIPELSERTAIPDLTEKEVEDFKKAVSSLDDEQLRTNELSLKMRMNECYGHINEGVDETTKSRNKRYVALREIVREELRKRQEVVK